MDCENAPTQVNNWGSSMNGYGLNIKRVENIVICAHPRTFLIEVVAMLLVPPCTFSFFLGENQTKGLVT